MHTLGKSETAIRQQSLFLDCWKCLKNTNTCKGRTCELYKERSQPEFKPGPSLRLKTNTNNCLDPRTFMWYSLALFFLMHKPFFQLMYFEMGFGCQMSGVQVYHTVKHCVDYYTLLTLLTDNCWTSNILQKINHRVDKNNISLSKLLQHAGSRRGDERQW